MTQADGIMELLDRECDALKRADFAALGSLAEEKERLIARLADAPPAAPEMLARLREKAERNARLLQAVQRGLDSAAATLRRMRAPAEALDTYTQTGQRTRIGATQGSLTRRA
jgi:flagellar biosynthesis/type III secretory pathway chaperone